ncbi:MAG TPA: FkbM family methyltransferase [Thermoanaerobaculia bacterium]|nr:FkbM family methyltransferase [Thermoanaerobaculia bacterium]
MLEIVKSVRMLLKHPLSRGRFSRIAFNTAKWQLASRLLRKEMIYDWVGGTKFYVRRGETGLTGNIYTGLLEFSDMMFLLHFLAAGDLFADIGANSGAYTILASGVKRARTCAFEPVPSTYERLVRNIALNRIEGLATPLRCAVGDKAGQVHFSSQFDTMNRVTEAQSRSAIVVDVTTLDDAFIDDLPALIKIDVEGYEEAVLRGGDRVLRQPAVQAIIAEVNEASHAYGFDESEVLRLLNRYGFFPCAYDPFRRLFTPLQGLNSNDNNTIFVRDIAALTRKIAQSALIGIGGRLL